MEKIRREYPDIAPAGPTYARAVRAGNTLYISGCTARGTEAQGGQAIEQFKATWDRIIRIVAAEGGKPSDIVKVTTFVTSMADWFPAPDEQQTVMDGYFNGQNPANSLVERREREKNGIEIEIEEIVVID